MFINFFTSPYNINKLSSSVAFNSNNDWSFLNSFVSISIVLSFAIIIFLMIFIFKIIKIIFISNESNNKILIINALKEFLKSILIILVFAVVFNLVFAIFDTFSRSLDKAFNQIENNLKYPIEKIPGILYQFITNEPLSSSNHNYLFPNDLLTKMDAMNWIFSILLVMSFSFFMLWIIWSIFQKMLEVFFLYLSFPISISFGLETNQIHWKIWIKEIINKIALIFVLMLFLRLYLYLFYYISQYAIINDKRWSNKNSSYQLYIAIFVTLALGGSMMFIIRMFSLKQHEYIGLIGSFKSFKQTRNFINNNDIKNYNNQTKDINLAPVNENIDYLKNEIAYMNNSMQTNYNDLKKAKVFDK